MKKTKIKGFATVSEVAAELDFSPQYVGREIRDNKLPAIELGQRTKWLIPVNEAEKYIKRKNGALKY